MSTLRRTDLVRVIGRREAGDHLYVVKGVQADDFTGVTQLSVHPLAPRLFVDQETAPREQDSLLPQELEVLPSPARSLEEVLSLRNEAWPTRTRQSIERLFALWLLLEDRKHLLDTMPVEQLAHQVSLLEYVKRQDLRRLLIADEVGLGKTIEAGLIINWMLGQKPTARVLYLAPAMLVDNVHGELKRLDVPARIDRYSSGLSTIGPGSLREAQVVVASIHKAAFEPNLPSWRDDSGPWDLIIVDECHHLSDWSNDGTSPQKQMRLIRDLVDKRLRPDGRLVLMSATPHQGNESKFRNLLKLLSNGGYRAASGSLDSVAGRVVYRTKEDVRGWDGGPLFSRRQVNEPCYVRLGPEYHGWLREIEAVFQEAAAGPAAWRKAQALQWAASSPRAGLAYLTRLALRAGMRIDGEPLLRDAARALLPYRNLGTDASLDAIRLLLERQAGVKQPAAVEDEASEDVQDTAPIDLNALRRALAGGLKLVGSNDMAIKLAPLLRWLVDEPSAKFVVFATPIETVDEIRRGVTRLLGEQSVVTITGVLKPHERRLQMQEFAKESVRVLVASRAGSEGINLQIAHRLVHFDVPWNPMELEQRVGRVHRYGSTQKVVVDTIVVEGSREQRMLRRCRARLAQIVEQLFGPEAAEGSRFEEMYGRVMSQVPSEELAEIIADEGFLTSSSERLDLVVQAGFTGWKASDEALRSSRDASLSSVPDRGHVQTVDLERFFDLLGAHEEPGWRHIQLVAEGGEVRECEAPARVWAFPGEGANIRRVADPIASLALRGPDGFRGLLERAGINLPAVAAKIREVVGGARRDVGRTPRAHGFMDGAGVVRLPESDWLRWLDCASLTLEEWQAGAVVLGWTLRLLHRGATTEAWTGVRLRMCTPCRKKSVWLADQPAAELVRLLWDQRKRQHTKSPPHRRADGARFQMAGLAAEAMHITPEVLKGSGEFAPERHDFEIAPILAVSIELRAGGTEPPEEEERQEEEAIQYFGTVTRPPADLIERIVHGIDELPPPSASSSGADAIFVLLMAEPAVLSSLDPVDRSRGFGVYVGTMARAQLGPLEERRDAQGMLRAMSLNPVGKEVVGLLVLDPRFKSLSREDATYFAGTLARRFEQIGVCVFENE